MKNKKAGKVYLVGAGPGDIGLFTLKGKECLETADVVIYDYLANAEILTYARPDAERIFVGKHSGARIMAQEEINRVMITKATEGKIVVRLKGGDPFIFGRGGEEAGELVSEGIPFEVIPGVSAAVSVPAYAGIPLSHRNYSSTIAFITGHEDEDKGRSSVAWDKISTGVDTIVVLMGITNLPSIMASLIENGRSPDTPVAVIQWGTTPVQKTVTGTLENIVKRTKSAAIRPPGIIVIGEVVRLREQLTWFEKMTLANPTLLYTSLKADILGQDILIAATRKGIFRIMFGDVSYSLQELRSLYNKSTLCRDDRYFEQILSELHNYFSGTPTVFTSELDPCGTVFQKKVWNALLKIPYGKTASYKDVAKMIGQPQAVRAVGSVCGKNPVPIIVPCHRVINSNGNLGGYSGGLGIKKVLLKLEGTNR